MNIAMGPNTGFSNTYNSRAILVVEGHDVNGWIKEFDLPEITLEHIEVPRTPQGFKVEGNIFKYNDFNITFFLDENFSLYFRLYDWLIGAVNGADFSRLKTTGSIFVFNNQMTVISTEFVFSGLMLKNLPSLTYNNFATDPQTLNVGFTFDQFTPKFHKATATNR